MHLSLVMFHQFVAHPEEFAIVAQHSRTRTVLAMRLVRSLDSTGRPFRLTLSRLSRWPAGLDVAMVGSNTGLGARYCAETLRQTGDINLARQAHAEQQVYMGN